MSESNPDGLLRAFAAKGASSELKHVAEEDLAFYVGARRNRLLAQWAAAELGHDADHVPRYLADLIAADLASPGTRNVVAKLKADFDLQGIHISVEELAAKIAEFQAEAWRQLNPGAPAARAGL